MKRIFILFCFCLFLSANGQVFDFSKDGDEKSNEILKDHIEQKFNDYQSQAVSYFCDIDNDGENEIIGIVKSQFFYSLAGYKLFVLKKKNDVWEKFKSDIFFDNAKEFEIENKKITYYKTVFYKNKKGKAKVKNNKIVTSKSLFDCFKNKKAHDIEEITKFSDGHVKNNLEMIDFHAHEQRSVDINYKNLNDKTKHYLEMK